MKSDGLVSEDLMDGGDKGGDDGALDAFGLGEAGDFGEEISAVFLAE